MSRCPGAEPGHETGARGGVAGEVADSTVSVGLRVGRGGLQLGLACGAAANEAVCALAQATGFDVGASIAGGHNFSGQLGGVGLGKISFDGNEAAVLSDIREGRPDGRRGNFVGRLSSGGEVVDTTKGVGEVDRLARSDLGPLLVLGGAVLVELDLEGMQMIGWDSRIT